MAVVENGEILGEYVVTRPIQAGGMASLFIGRHRGGGPPVALKIAHPHLLRDETFKTMFIAEAELGMRFSHRGIVRVEELFESDGRLIMVMEYIEGASLFEVLRRLSLSAKRLSPELAVHIATEVADALHYAHELRGPSGPLNLVHRDLSPQNILLSFAGETKVIDFGIAKFEGRGMETEAGVIRGKLGYMPPEQVKGKEKLDRRTDIYALGVVLWEMLTCRRLFKADTDVEMIAKVARPHIPSPSLFENVPSDLEQLIDEVLQADRYMRLGTAGVVSERLQRLRCAGRTQNKHLAAMLAAVLPDRRESATMPPPIPASAAEIEHTVVAMNPSFAIDNEAMAPPEPTVASRPQLGIVGIGPMGNRQPTEPMMRSKPPPPPPRPAQSRSLLKRAPAPPPPPPPPRPNSQFQLPGQELSSFADAPATVAQFQAPPEKKASVLKPLLTLVMILVAAGALGGAYYLATQGGLMPGMDESPDGTEPSVLPPPTAEPMPAPRVREITPTMAAGSSE